VIFFLTHWSSHIAEPGTGKEFVSFGSFFLLREETPIFSGFLFSVRTFRLPSPAFVTEAFDSECVCPPPRYLATRAEGFLSCSPYGGFGVICVFPLC